MIESCPQIVIIGGGPVGLFTGIQIKILLPEINLVIYEKHKQYQRNHVLRLNKTTTFFGLPPSPLLTNMIDNLPSIVRTSVFETQLLEIAKQLQIPIIYKNLNDLNEFSQSEIVIGADGSHSLVRQLVFNNQMKSEQVLKYVLEIKYEVDGQGEKLDYLRYQYRTQKQLEYIINEHIGTQRDNRTPITLHLVINEQIYEQMKSATFKQPYYLHTHQHLIPKKLLETIIIWMNVKKEYVNEKRIENSEKITCIALSAYQTRDFVHYNDQIQQYTCLVGDAAFGVPFFRSLNNGIICSKKLALIIQLYFNQYSSQRHQGNVIAHLTFTLSTTANRLHSLIHSDKPFNAYNQFVQLLAKKEILLAQNKARILFAAKIMNQINGIVPWQVNKWSTSKVEDFKQNINNNYEVETVTHDDACSIAVDDETYDLVQEFDFVPSMDINNIRHDES